MHFSTLLSNIPIRSQATDNATQIDELLFGEVVECLDINGAWSRVKNAVTHIQGYVLTKQLLSVDAAYAEMFAQGKLKRLFYPIATTENERSSIRQYLPGGALLQLHKDKLKIGGELFSLPEPFPQINHQKKEDILRDAALLYLNVPEKKGGRTIFGMDPTLFLTHVFSFADMYSGNTLDEMALLGEGVNFVHEMQCGDIAFFEDQNQIIVHAGICIGESWIMHADGKVKSGRLDQQGLFDPKENKYIHKLRLIKRYI